MVCVGSRFQSAGGPCIFPPVSFGDQCEDHTQAEWQRVKTFSSVTKSGQWNV